MALKKAPRKPGAPWLRRMLEKWPGKERFGPYRFMPFFFALGGALEFAMIKWTVGDTNFYKTYKKRQILNELAKE